ncbi:hypothetical protein OIU91_34055 [Streptomyces sp. NBC_01456]|uniref:hypothetical protein n=1 Tax=unclassified Streptomyces TaxID=2593676 RepID=UPI002E352254|nr:MULTISPECIES: hypothetical protein [unclassified Streptomyces]
MSTDAEFADARRIPPIPPQPPRRPAPSAPPMPAGDPHTAVLRRVPAEPSAPGAPAVPPRPAVPPPAPTGAQPPAAGAPLPPHPDRAPGTPSRAVPPQSTARPDAFRDTAAFHLAHSQDLWSGPGAPSGTGEPAPATPRTAPGAPARPPRPPWSAPLPPQTAAPAPGGLAHRPAPGRPGARALAAAACLVLGVGLIGGAAAGSWLTDEAAGATPDAAAAFAKGRDVWHSTPVDTLFPRTVNGFGAGPGGADRTWSRIAVAPDGGCAGAYDPRLADALARAGCVRLLRATYVDATRSSVITVGAQITKADQPGMMALNTRFSTGNLGTRTDLMPLPYAARDTPAQDFGRAQRVSWTVRVLTDLPVVVYAVSGFADGRTFAEPQPAEAATRPGATTAPAESGLGHDAKGLADRIGTDFRKAAGSLPRTTEASS